MNAHRFMRTFLALRHALQTQNFSTKELNQLCLQGALKCEELHLQESAQNVQEEQIRAKMGIDYLNAQYTLQATKAQTLSALIQCQSMLKSLKDNAAINRANAYVSFLQVVGSASNTSAIAQHAQNVIHTINQIGTQEDIKELETCVTSLSQELARLNALDGGSDCVQIFAQSLETLPNCPVKVWGFSMLKDAQECFLVDGQVVSRGGCSCLRAPLPRLIQSLIKAPTRACRHKKV
ncbi:hypothetical protein ACFOPX_04995 [Helicobacter baculiformis]|uniref:Uncharacterized protein n=1 Tax=Helicobacter baculiformis TaxID=427351 RepID=A0ABV7ZH60_9HELI|nr:hypothetical protein [Helicobacter baculiformis]